jgi:hypothetical protein
MSRTAKPTILAIDDQPETVAPLKLALSEHAKVVVLSPPDVKQQHLRDAHLILLDYDLEEWDGSTTGDLANRPRNGLALAAMMRAHLGDQGLASTRATAFALRSAYLEKLSPEAGVESNEHIIARHNNLEWVFEKSRTDNDRFLCLAQAVVKLRQIWSGAATKRRTACDRLLQLPNEDWRDAASEDVDACHPPIHDLAARSHGVPLLRWLLHRVLPYPCFLWGQERLAVRLRVTVAELGTILAKRSRLAQALRRCRYEGILAGFVGERWWSSGVEHELWKLTSGKPRDVGELKRLTNANLVESTEPELVMCVSENHRWLQEPIPMSQAVRIQPDDWPPFAEQAWATVELARSVPSIKSLVLRSDVEKLRVGA